LALCAIFASSAKLGIHLAHRHSFWNPKFQPDFSLIFIGLSMV
jgi:hypothetical protein